MLDTVINFSLELAKNPENRVSLPLTNFLRFCGKSSWSLVNGTVQIVNGSEMGVSRQSMERCKKRDLVNGSALLVNGTEMAKTLPLTNSPY